LQSHHGSGAGHDGGEATRMTRFIVRRQWGHHMTSFDYLADWDAIWGPIWSGRHRALIFPTNAAAKEALATASVIMAPVPWIVPNLGRSRVEVREVP
jgi:hypothetical protein